MARKQVFTIVTIMVASIICTSNGDTPKRRRSRPNAFIRDGNVLNGALRLQERIQEHGCEASVCFALDGSSSIGDDDFENAKEFSQITSVVINTDSRAKFGAVQFGLSNLPISNVTANQPTFIAAVGAACSAQAPRTFVGAGIFGCSRLLRNSNGRHVIVVLSDGRDNFGASPQRVTDDIATESDDSIIAVAIADADIPYLQKLAPGGNYLIDARNSQALSNAMQRAVELICEL